MAKLSVGAKEECCLPHRDLHARQQGNWTRSVRKTDKGREESVAVLPKGPVCVGGASLI